MKKILFLFLLLGMVQGIWAQPEARRQAAAQKKAAISMCGAWTAGGRDFC